MRVIFIFLISAWARRISPVAPARPAANSVRRVMMNIIDPGGCRLIDSAMAALTITDSTWDSEVMKAGVPVLVDFWGDGCPPCRVMSPLIDAIADEFAVQKVGALSKAELKRLLDQHL